jgi:hypothetical protein
LPSKHNSNRRAPCGPPAHPHHLGAPWRHHPAFAVLLRRPLNRSAPSTPSPSGSGPGTRSSQSAGSSPARMQTPNRAVSDAAAHTA